MKRILIGFAALLLAAFIPAAQVLLINPAYQKGVQYSDPLYTTLQTADSNFTQLFNGGGSGTVTSVGLSSSGSITITGSPITSAGTLTADLGALTGDCTTSAGSLAITCTKTSGVALGTLATQNGTFSGTSSGTNTGDQTITLTGDVTGSGTGSFATTWSQALTPTNTGIWKWSLAEPRLILANSGQGADLKNWDFDLTAGVLTGRTRTDADGAGINWLSVTRGTTTAITDVSMGNATNNNTFHVLGTGQITFGGALAVTGNIQGTAAINGATSFISGGAPVVSMNNTGQGSDLKRWAAQISTTHYQIGTQTDAGAFTKIGLDIARGTTTVVSAVTLGNATDATAITLPSVTTGTNADFLCLSAGGVVLLQASSCTISSLRFKESVVNYKGRALSDIDKMRVASFNMKVSPNPDPNYRTRQIGLIAEDIAKVEPKCAIYERDMKTPKSYRQECVIALLVKGMQEQQAEIETLKASRH